MSSGSFRFGQFTLDPNDRRLMRGDQPLDLNSRYFDALALLVQEQGRLVSKDRFMDEVWRGIPVTDEALTQCIRTLRRQLGDDAARPAFIETVPKHGYRFIAPVESAAADNPQPPIPQAPRPSSFSRSLLLFTVAGTIGAGLAGLIGGLFYGLAGAPEPLQPGMGAISVLLVLVCLTLVLALMGGLGVSAGIAAAIAAGRPAYWRVIGGATGGFLVGGIVKLLGIDAFNLLLGRSPGDITGALEGALLGGAVGLAACAATGPALRRGMALAALVGAVGSACISLLGGRLMGGSLDLLSRTFPGSSVRLDPIGAFFGESGFGPISQIVTAALEGALFSACVVGAMIQARRDFGSARRQQSLEVRGELGQQPTV